MARFKLLALFALFVVTSVASYSSLANASYILYKNTYLIPVLSTGIIMSVAIGLLLVKKQLESFANTLIKDIEEDLKLPDPEKDEDQYD